MDDHFRLATRQPGNLDGILEPGAGSDTGE
jgi:hypothetical protein